MRSDEAMRLLDLAELFDITALRVMSQSGSRGERQRWDGMAGGFAAAAFRLRQHVRDDVKVEP